MIDMIGNPVPAKVPVHRFRPVFSELRHVLPAMEISILLRRGLLRDKSVFVDRPRRHQ